MMTDKNMTEPFLKVEDLRVEYFSKEAAVKAVNGVSFELGKGWTLGLVGETGAGKTTIAKSILRILPDVGARVVGGKVYLEDKVISEISEKEMREIRGKKISIIFQDPYSSIDPRKTVEYTISEPLKVCGRYSKGEIQDISDELMSLVGIDQRLRVSYPHELDGGRRQRVGIARALALNPDFVVCDEPVSALDVSIQAQVLNLRKTLQQQKGLTYMFVTHNFSVVKHISDQICVMYLGQVVELCPTNELFLRPLHPYTKALLSAIPTIDIHSNKMPEILEGELVSPVNPKPGCRFAARCKFATEACLQPQTQQEVSPGHFVRCCRVNEIN